MAHRSWKANILRYDETKIELFGHISQWTAWPCTDAPKTTQLSPKDSASTSLLGRLESAIAANDALRNNLYFQIIYYVAVLCVD